METSSTFGAELQRLRKRRGLNQRGLAHKIHRHLATVSAWERCLYLPDCRDVVLDLAHALDLNCEETDHLLFTAQFPLLTGEERSDTAPQKDEAEHITNDPLPRAFPVYWNIPYPQNMFFTGRERLLARLYELLHHSNPVVAVIQAQALCGLGGVGKTQVALEYAYRYCQEYTAVFWLKADTSESILTDFLNIAVLLDLPERGAADQQRTITAIRRWFRLHSSWLVIFDNADDLTMVRDFFPFGQGHILLSSRAQAMGKLASHLTVEEMDLETGMLFLLRRAGVISADASLEAASVRHRQWAAAIVEELGGLPLALDQAGAYMEECPCGLEDYLRLYQQQQRALLSRRGGAAGDHPIPVTATWSLSFQQIEQDSPVAAELLRCCAFLDPDAIPEELLLQGAAELGPLLVTVEENSFAFNEALQALWRYSLIRRVLESRMLSQHRLVQVVLRQALAEGVQRTWVERVVRAVNRVFPTEIRVANWEVCRRLLPQAQNCALLIEQWNCLFLEAAQLLNQTAYYLREQARYPEAERFYRHALKIREQTLGEEHLDVAQSCYNLARLYFETARYKEAEGLYQRALSIRQHLLGSEHVLIAQTLNSIALTLWYWSIRYDEAGQLYEQALSIFGRTIGREHPLTAHCMNNLALLYVTLADYTQAEQLHLEVLAIRERLLPPVHLDTAQSLQNLACVYVEKCNQEQYQQAEQLLLRSLQMREQILGAEHPQTARSLHNLARLYEAQGRYAEAEQLYRQVLSIREKMLGPENQKTKATRSAYQTLVRKLGQNDETGGSDAGQETHAAGTV